MSKGNIIIKKTTNRLGIKLKIILKKIKFIFSILFSIISKIIIKGKKKIIGSQIKTDKKEKIVNEKNLNLLSLGIIK
jgi:hypothetical protein